MQSGVSAASLVLAACGLALSVAAHVTLVVSLGRHGWWRAPLAFAVPPLAPWWGFRFGMPRRSWAWIAAVAIYAIAVVSVAWQRVVW